MADKKISQLSSATTPLAGTETLPIVQSSSTVKVAVSDLTAGRNVAVGAAVGVPRTLSVGGSVAIERFNATPQIAIRGGTDATVGQEYRFSLTQANGLYISNAVIGGSQLENWFFRTNGDLEVKSGNLVIGTAGKGIDFSATTNAAGMTSELLNDYEEGTWTPVLYGTTTAGTQTYTWQRGTYTKIGNRVIADFTVLIGTKDATTAGQLEISGLPFTVNGNAGIPQAAFAFRSNMALQANAYYHTAQPKINTAVLILGQAGSTVVNTGNTAFTDGSQLIGSVQYYV